MLCLVDVVFGALAYYSVGYAISFGTPSTPFSGVGDFFLSSEDRNTSFLYPRYLFQFSFAATSTTIVSGCIAMRMKFKVYCLYAFYAGTCWINNQHCRLVLRSRPTFTSLRTLVYVSNCLCLLCTLGFCGKWLVASNGHA